MPHEANAKVKMGIVRLVLAIAVVIDHSSTFFGLQLTGGRVAVQMFYMISGYYMALVLASKYTGPGSYGRFLANRGMRLFPSYWAVAVLTLVTSVAARVITGEWGRLEPWMEYGDLLSTSSKAFLAAANIFIVGQDTVMFTGFTSSGHALRFSTDFSRSNPPVHEFLFVPQAWSLSVELMFYGIAPVLLRQRTFVLMGVLAGSLGLRAWLYLACGLSHDPWTYRFFPCELALFVLGAIAFRRPTFGEPTSTQAKLYGTAAIVGVVSLIVSYPAWAAATEPHGELARWAFYGLFFLLLPRIFTATRYSRLDSAIGEFSYPLYICHVLVVWTLKGLSGRLGLQPWLGELSVAGSLALAYVIIVVVINPIDRWRRNGLVAQV